MNVYLLGTTSVEHFETELWQTFTVLHLDVYKPEVTGLSISTGLCLKKLHVHHFWVRF